MGEQPFLDAEEAVFWAYNCQQAIDDGAKIQAGYSSPPRPCTVADIFLAIKRLYESGQIKIDHVMTLKFFGLRGLRPDPVIYGRGVNGRDEREAYSLWMETMDLLDIELIRKGIIEPREKYYG